MTEKQKTDEIRHWMTIAENAKVVEHDRQVAISALNHTHTHPSVKKQHVQTRDQNGRKTEDRR
jgi:hypothetical protein